MHANAIELKETTYLVENVDLIKKKPTFCANVAADVLDAIDPYNNMDAVSAHDFYQTAYNICMGS